MATPPPPPGFELDDPNAPPEGFKLDAPAPEKRSLLGEAGHRAAEAWRNASVPSDMADVKERLGRLATGVAHPFAEFGREVADEAKHPLRTLQGAPLARAAGYSTPEAVAHSDAVNREMVRGAQSNVPLAGLVHERLTGFPEESAADAAEAPHAHGAGAAGGAVAMAAAPKVVPLVGKGLRAAGNAAQDVTAAVSEGSMARSAARGPGAVKAAVKDLAEKAVDAKHAMPVVAAGYVGGHTGAGIAALLTLAKPALRAIVTTADEGLAALARRAGGAPVAAAEAAEVVNPALAKLRDALKTATPAQAEEINAAIAGLEKQAAGPRAPRQGATPTEDLPIPREPIGKAPPTEPGAPKPRVEEPDVDIDITEAKAPPSARATREPAERGRIETTGYQRVVDRAESNRRISEPSRRPAAYQKAVDRFATLAREATSQREFIQDAVKSGFDARVARKIWKAAHPYKPAAAAPSVAEELDL